MVAPSLTPPPAEEKALDREGVLRIAHAADDPADAIERLDTQPFAFELDEEALTWFRGRELSPQVMDYLEKRSKVDWESLRGDVDPAGPR